MDDPDFDRVQAIHPHWSGFLRLAKSGNQLLHENHGSAGVYFLKDRQLTVFWDDFGPDEFFEFSGIYVHRKLVKQAPRVEDLFAVSLGDHPLISTRLSVVVPNSDHEVSLRLRTSDVPTFHQVFVDQDYDSENLPRAANTIVDLGANIGLSTVFFGLRFPQATILAVEPDEDNFAELVKNTARFGKRVQPVHAAAWLRDGCINVHSEAETGDALGAWGIQVSDRVGRSNKIVPCYTVGSLLQNVQFMNVDILKVDIEGAETEVFADGCQEWLNQIELIIVETHDRFRAGSDAAVRNAVQATFEELPSRAENLFFRRMAID